MTESAPTRARIPRSFWTTGDGVPYLAEIESGKLTKQDVADTVGVSKEAVGVALWHYRRKAKGLPRPEGRRTGTRKARTARIIQAPVSPEDKQLAKVLNSIADYAGHLIDTHQKTLTARCESVERENTHLRDEVETLKKQLTLQALSFKKQEQEFRKRVMAKAGMVGGD